MIWIWSVGCTFCRLLCLYDCSMIGLLLLRSLKLKLVWNFRVGLTGNVSWGYCCCLILFNVCLKWCLVMKLMKLWVEVGGNIPWVCHCWLILLSMHLNHEVTCSIITVKVRHVAFVHHRRVWLQFTKLRSVSPC